METEKRIKAFVRLGCFLRQFGTSGENKDSEKWLEKLNLEFMAKAKETISEAAFYNPWFTEKNTLRALASAGKMLKQEKLEKWLSRYPLKNHNYSKKKIAVVMAGNIPIVGVHDMLCVLVSGHTFYGKLSSKDDKLMPLLASIICGIEPGFKNEIFFEKSMMKDFDAVIATGSNNSARYFEYYFGKHPNIIRKNRNSAAILNGSETREDLEGLADDIFRYFGLGCRNVSKLFVPENYDFSYLIKKFSGFSGLSDHNKWDNNYRYRKTILLMNNIPHYDTGFALIKEDPSLSSPVTVVHFEYAENEESAWDMLEKQKNSIQCVASKNKGRFSSVPFGKTQEPGLWDYADNVDTMEFLLNI